MIFAEFGRQYDFLLDYQDLSQFQFKVQFKMKYYAVCKQVNWKF